MDWNHTASLLAMLAEVNRDPKKRRRPFSAADFHPETMAERARIARGTPLTTENLSMLKELAGGKIHRDWKEAGT